jgi:hypothetical protein
MPCTPELSLSWAKVVAPLSRRQLQLLGAITAHAGEQAGYAAV